MKKSNLNANETNVIIYCRVSTDEQRQGTSVDVQEERLKAHCTYKGYNIINIPEFHDCKEDESAKTGQRRNSVAELSEDDRQTVHEEWQI